MLRIVAGVGSVLAIGLLLVAGEVRAAEATGDVIVSATLSNACEVSAPSAAIDFGTFAALSSTGDKSANSGSTFQVACSTSATPTIYSASTRSMTSGASSLPFNLCLASCTGSNDLATTSAGDPLTITQDGTLQTVTLYGRTLATNFAGLPAGAYSQTVTVAVVY